MTYNRKIKEISKEKWFPTIWI